MKTNKPKFSTERKYISQWLDAKKDTNILYADATRTGITCQNNFC